jgi:hypothetical protein
LSSSARSVFGALPQIAGQLDAAVAGLRHCAEQLVGVQRQAAQRVQLDGQRQAQVAGCFCVCQ